MAATNTVPEVGLVLYPNAQPASVHGLSDLFAVAERIHRARSGSAKPSLRLSHFSGGENNGPVLRAFDTYPGANSELRALILPPSLEDPSTYSESDSLTKFLRSQHAAGTTITSICAGTFVLAATGLLDGRTATTHWGYAELFERQFREVRIDIDKLIVDDGDVITAGGMMAWTDLGLTLVDRLLGPAVMLETARALLIDPPGREQRYYRRFTPRVAHGDGAVLKIQQWLMQANPRDISAASMAAKSGLEDRTFLRRFRKATGISPMIYIQHLRIGVARDMLETTNDTVDHIAWQIGYGDAKFFRTVFVKITGLTPSAYRQRFKVTTSIGRSSAARLAAPIS